MIGFYFGFFINWFMSMYYDRTRYINLNKYKINPSINIKRTFPTINDL